MGVILAYAFVRITSLLFMCFTISALRRRKTGSIPKLSPFATWLATSTPSTPWCPNTSVVFISGVTRSLSCATKMGKKLDKTVSRKLSKKCKDFVLMLSCSVLIHHHSNGCAASSLVRKFLKGCRIHKDSNDSHNREIALPWQACISNLVNTWATVATATKELIKLQKSLTYLQIFLPQKCITSIWAKLK